MSKRVRVRVEVQPISVDVNIPGSSTPEQQRSYAAQMALQYVAEIIRQAQDVDGQPVVSVSIENI